MLGNKKVNKTKIQWNFKMEKFLRKFEKVGNFIENYNQS